jgi:hypothetical protein
MLSTIKKSNPRYPDIHRKKNNTVNRCLINNLVKLSRTST